MIKGKGWSWSAGLGLRCSNKVDRKMARARVARRIAGVGVVL